MKGADRDDDEQDEDPEEHIDASVRESLVKISQLIGGSAGRLRQRRLTKSVNKAAFTTLYILKKDDMSCLHCVATRK